SGDIPQAFAKAGIKPGQIPVVGWGNTLPSAQGVQDGYLNAAGWMNPDSSGYLPIFMLYEAAQGKDIHYNIYTMNMYDNTTAASYIKFTTQMSQLTGTSAGTPAATVSGKQLTF